MQENMYKNLYNKTNTRVYKYWGRTIYRRRKLTIADLKMNKITKQEKKTINRKIIQKHNTK